VVTAFGYALGFHAPGQELMLGALPTAHYQLLAHGLATAALRAAGVPQVMIANNYSPAWPASQGEADMAATRAYDILHNRMFTDPVLLGRYPGLTAFGLGGGGDGTGSSGDDPASGLDCVQDGDLAVISAPADGIGVNYCLPTRLSALPDSPLPFQL
jgi:beta-glucosidase